MNVFILAIFFQRSLGVEFFRELRRKRVPSGRTATGEKTLSQLSAVL